ncbi:hypothetical protein BH20ACI3_BH20ACI3_19630 [soil metagenome]
MINVLEERVPQLELCPCINVSFSLSGKQLPADHGYLLYSAISKSSSSLHGIDWLAIELISGFPSGRGVIDLPGRDATLRLRIPADLYRDVLPLAGKRLDIGGHQIRLGLPVARPLEPAPSLYARVVTIKKFTEPEPFLEAVSRQADSLEFQTSKRLSAITDMLPQSTCHNADHSAQRLSLRQAQHNLRLSN